MALPATDSFNNATGGSLALETYNASWTVHVGDFSVGAGDDIASPSNSGAISMARWDADVFNADQYSQTALEAFLRR